MRTSRNRIWTASAGGVLFATIGLLYPLWRPAIGAYSHPPRRAATVTEFRDTLGVNVHMAYSWTSYSSSSNVLKALNYLGISHVRDVFIPWEAAAPQFDALAAAGIRYDMVLPVIDKAADIPDFVARVKAFNTRHPDSIVAVEGPNEVNIWPVLHNGETTIASAAEVQRALFTAVRNEAELGKVGVYNLTLAFTDAAQHRQLGDLTAATDFANAHAYIWYWGPPDQGLDYLMGFSAISALSRPQVVTETGYTTLASDPYSGVPEDAQATLLLQTAFDAFARNVTRTFIYELLDEKDDPKGTDAQQHFGLFHVDGKPKPAAVALHNLSAILREDSKPGTQSPDEPVVTDLGRDLRQLWLRKADGRACLVLWREGALLQKGSKRRLTVASAGVKIGFGKPQDIAVFRPLQSDASSERRRGSDLEIKVGAQPILIEVTDRATPP